MSAVRNGQYHRRKVCGDSELFSTGDQEFTTENAEDAETVWGPGQPRTVRKNRIAWLSARSAFSVVNTCFQAVKLSSSSVAPADAGTGRRR